MGTHDGNAARWAETYPELGRAPIPNEPCYSPEYFERERENVFRRLWLKVARVEEIPRPGDYLVKNILGASVLLQRGMDMKIRAFHNMCSHRSNRLLWGERGNCTKVRCRYHGWTYDTEGRLTLVPDEDQFYGLKKEQNGLTPILLDTVAGFVFINFDSSPKETLKEFLGDWGEQLERYPFEDLPEVHGWEIEINANWKIILDAFQEIYHVGPTHGRLFPSWYPEHNPNGHLPYVKLGKFHRLYSAEAGREKMPPMLEVASKHAPTFSDMMHGHHETPSYLNPQRIKNWGCDLLLVFPNFSIATLDGMSLSYTYWPLAADRTLLEVTQYYPKAKTPAEQVSREFSKLMLREPITEDFANCEMIQSVLPSKGKTQYILQDNEILIRHFYKTVDDLVRA